MDQTEMKMHMRVQAGAKVVRKEYAGLPCLTLPPWAALKQALQHHGTRHCPESFERIR